MKIIVLVYLNNNIHLDIKIIIIVSRMKTKNLIRIFRLFSNDIFYKKKDVEKISNEFLQVSY